MLNRFYIQNYTIIAYKYFFLSFLFMFSKLLDESFEKSEIHDKC